MMSLESEQIAALEFINKQRIYPSTKSIEQETNCNALALGDLLHRGLIIPIFDGWELTLAGMRELKGERHDLSH